jgi:hypothetical protein
VLKIFILSFFAILASCNQSPEEEVTTAIDVAQTYLSQDECQKAIDLLEEVGRQNDDGVYLQVLASAYACRADFDELNFIKNDIPALDTSSGGLFKSLSIMSKSYEATAGSAHYSDLETAMNILLQADGGVEPSQANRNSKYGARRAGDMGLQNLYMGFIQLGKFLNFYGNVDATGMKGLGPISTDEQGAVASTCFATYNYAPAIAYLQAGSNPGGICNDPGGADSGHPNLSFIPADLTQTKTRMCEGLVIITNMIDVLNNITLTSNTTLAALQAIKTTINDYKTLAVTVDPTLATLMNTTSQSVCETLVATQSEFERIQVIYAALFETGLK